MKTCYFFRGIVPAIFAVTLLVSCLNDEPASERERIQKILSTGDWSIRQLLNDSNQTEKYKEAFLSFKKENVLELSNAGIRSQGEWFVRESIKKSNHLQISFSDSTIAISGDWKIVDYTKTEFRLEDATAPDNFGVIKKATLSKILQ
jgi:hypothetical protein